MSIGWLPLVASVFTIRFNTQNLVITLLVITRFLQWDLTVKR